MEGEDSPLVISFAATRFVVFCNIFNHEKEAATGNGSKTPRLRSEKGRTMALFVAGLVGSQSVVFRTISKRQREIASGKGQKHPADAAKTRWGCKLGRSVGWKMKNKPILWLGRVHTATRAQREK